MSSEKGSDKSIIEKDTSLATHQDSIINTVADSDFTLQADLNKLTRQPEFSINLGPQCYFTYNGDVSRPNERCQWRSGWCTNKIVVEDWK
jgi:hypothetical protein